ncbi:zf-HC2 domain-containing protein [Streptomyces sp. NPDC058092]|uniref:zf-HC2 domain-containing protein n=1 Tax=Streptomyces sp. NPDC058092 TaxID=3346336 RepID=UPI0036E39678
MNGGFAMIEARCLTKMSGEKPVVEECRTIRELLAQHALKILAPDEASAVGAHLAICDTCRNEHDCLAAAVPAHLTLLRDALAGGQGRNRRACAANRAERGHGSPRHRTPDRAARTTQITLSQWVSKTTSYIK